MGQGTCGNGHTVGQSSSPSLAVAVEEAVEKVVGIELAEVAGGQIQPPLFLVSFDGIEFGEDTEYHDLWTCRPRKNYFHRLTPRRQ